jgi:hypothetical protein
MFNYGRVRTLRNDIAGDDWVVALFPRFYEQIRKLPGFGKSSFFDLGSGGFNGFGDDAANRHAVRFFTGGHSGALSDENRDTIVTFIRDGEVVQPPNLARAPDGLIAFFTNLAFLVWILLAAGLIACCILVWRLGSTPARKLAGVSAFLIGVGVILNTI